jgi:hypothetical protein
MLTVLLTLLAVALGLVAFLWTGTLLAQSYFYDSPTDGMRWRAPAAAAILTAFLGIWCLAEYINPNRTDTIFTISSEQVAVVPKFWSVRRSDAGDEKEIPFERKTVGPNQVEYLDEQGGRWARSKSGMMVAMIVEEKNDDEVTRTRFNAEMKDGKFPTTESRGPAQGLRYIEENGTRYIAEERPGQINSRHPGRLVLNFFINLIFFGLWFAALWPLLRFQWAHALGFAFACWLLATALLVPFMLEKARAAGLKKAAEQKVVVAIPFILDCN